jgi:hypothetical protein
MKDEKIKKRRRDSSSNLKSLAPIKEVFLLISGISQAHHKFT